MTELDPARRALAQAYGIATEYHDWQGRHTEIGADTIAAVLIALGVDAETPESAAAALAEHGLSPWRRPLPPCVVGQQGTALTADVHVREGVSPSAELILEDGSRRPLGLPEPEAGREIDGVEIRRHRMLLPADLPLGYHRLALTGTGPGRRSHRDHHPALGGDAAERGRPALVGAGRPALQRPVRDVLGRRRPGRPGHPVPLVGGARCGLPADQPAACGRAGAADGAVALPADHPAVRQPGLHPDHRRRGLRRPAGHRQGPGGRTGRRDPGPGGVLATDRPGRRLGRQA